MSYGATVEAIAAKSNLKPLGPIDCKFHGHRENDGFVLCEYRIKQYSSFRKYTNMKIKKITCQQ